MKALEKARNLPWCLRDREDNVRGADGVVVETGYLAHFIEEFGLLTLRRVRPISLA